MNNWLWLATAMALGLAGCNQSGNDMQPADPQVSHSNTGAEPQKRPEIKKAVKLGTDASKIGIDTYQFMTLIDGLPKSATPDQVQFEQLIFQPSRQLLIRWGTEVKQTDSVVGDKYTICKAALVSLNSWARAVIDQRSHAQSKQQVYEQHKKLCTEVVTNS